MPKPVKICIKQSGKWCPCLDCRRQYSRARYHEQKRLKEKKLVRDSPLAFFDKQLTEINEQKLAKIKKLENEAYETAKNYLYTNLYKYALVDCIAATHDFFNDLNAEQLR